MRKEDLFPYIPEFSNFIVHFFQEEAIPYDLVHANFWMSGIAAMDLKRKLGVPFVVTFHALGKVRRLHQGAQDGFPPERLDYEDRIVQEADGIIAECPQDKEDMVHLYQADPSKIQIVPCGFDPNELCPVDKTFARKKLGLAQDERIVLQLGRMVPRKGVDTVIEGLAQLRDRKKMDARLLIVGGETDKPDENATPELGRLKAIAEQRGISDRVQFMGRKPRGDLKYYYSAADVFVSTPWYEPFGITPVEAMACGTPVIGSKVGGIQFSVRDGETGCLIPAKNAGILADRLAYLFSHPTELEKMSSAGIKRANQFFTWERVTRSIAAIYERVIAESQSGTGTASQSLRIVEDRFRMAAETFEQSRMVLSHSIVETAQAIQAALLNGNKILVCGNGGSAADAQHFSAELVGRFVKPERIALPVIALTADSAVMTAWANDIGYEKVFSRQVEAYGQPGDVLLAISTTGQSKNLIAALEAARQRQMICLALLGGDGGDVLS